MPEVTVCMPVYNAMPYLPAAISSVLTQKYENFELIVVDDGSTDRGVDYIASLNDARIRLIQQANQGTGAAVNRCIEAAQAPLFARLDADDVALPERLARQVECMSARPEVAVLGSQYEFLCSNRVLKAPRVPSDHASIVAAFLGQRGAMCNSSLMMRTDHLRKIGGCRFRGAGEDIDLCLRLSTIGQLANLPEVLQQYRLHDQSAVFKRQQEIELGMAFAIECHLQRQAGRAEPTLDEFIGCRNARGIVRRMGDRRRYWSVLHYRRSLIAKAHGKRWTSWGRLLAAAAMRPGSAFKRLTRAR